MNDYQPGLKVVDQVLVLKKLNSEGESLVAQTPDSDENLLYLDSSGALKSKSNLKTSLISLDADFADQSSAVFFPHVGDQAYRIGARSASVGVKAITGIASTDIITCTAHGYVDGEVVSFLSLTGGAGLFISPQRYFLRDVTVNTFKVTLTSGGAAINFTTDISAGTVIWHSAPRLKVGTLVDSVGNSMTSYLHTQMARAFGLSSPLSYAPSVQSGDGWFSDGTGPKPYDFALFPTGIYASIGSGTGTVIWSDGGAPVTADKVVIYYSREVGAGVFKVQRNTTSSISTGWVDEPGYDAVDASAGTGTFGKITLTCVPGINTVRFVHVSGGRVRVIQPIYINATATGLTVRRFDRGGLGTYQAVLWDATIADDYLTECDLDMVSYEGKEESTGYRAVLDSLLALFDSAKTNTEFLMIESTPLDTDDAAEADMIAQNAIIRQFARDNGFFSFDRHVLTRAQMVELGWRGDGIHAAAVMNAWDANRLLTKFDWLWNGPGDVRPGNTLGDTAHAFTRLALGGTKASPALTYDVVSGGLDIRRRGGGNFLNYYNSAGTLIMTISLHDNQNSSPSTFPGMFGLVGFGWKMVVHASDELGLANSVGTAATAHFRALNTPRSIEAAGTTMLAGRGYIAANGTQTYTLPAAPAVGERHTIGGRNASWVVAQPASTIIRAGSSATTSGTGGTLSGGQYDTVELMFVGTTSGSLEWRVISASPGASLVWV